MARQRAPRPASSPPAKSITATISLGGYEFSFQLHHRPLRLGSSGTIEYYWMDSSQFRSLGAGSSAKNFQNCLDHWFTGMWLMGLEEEPEQLHHYLWTQCYPQISSGRAMQKIYRDAFLRGEPNNSEVEPLPDSTRFHIQDVVKSRDRLTLQREFDQLFERFEPPADKFPALQEAARNWLNHGMELMTNQGRDGVSQFLDEVDSWLKRFRKDGGNALERDFINMFSYESKVSFYLCYANAWCSLIPWLKEHRGLDGMSERFLRVWHNQNQAIELAPEATVGEVHVPFRPQTTIVDRASDGALDPPSPALPTEPTYLPDVFSGQVLSLHPLSGVFMQDPRLCAIAGEYFAIDPTIATDAQAVIDHEHAYWNLIGAILSAAHSYRLAWDRQEDDRKLAQPEQESPAVPRNDEGQPKEIRSTKSTTPENAFQEDDPTTEAELLEAFAAAQQKRCPGCRGRLDYVSIEPPDQGAEHVDALFTCPSCRKPVPLVFPSLTLEQWLDHQNRQG